MQLLQSLGALDDEEELTDLGSRLAGISIDPRCGDRRRGGGVVAEERESLPPGVFVVLVIFFFCHASKEGKR